MSTTRPFIAISQEGLKFILALLVFCTSAHAACDQSLSAGANIGSAISAAGGGATICLNDGTYNGISLSNVNKTSMVTVTSVNGAAQVNVGALNLNNVSNVRLSGVTFGGGILTGHHLELLNSIGTQRLVNGVSQILKITGTIANAAILIDHIHYSDIPNPCTNNACVEGRISVMDGGNPSGITISNSFFSGGSSDGIQVGGSPVGVQIIGNEFTNIHAANGTHTDCIQTYYTGSGTVIKNNYFHDCETGIMAPDGGTNEQIIGNVFDLTDYPYVIVVNNWTGGLISHNTFKYGTSCSWNSCGTLWVRATTGLNVKDNILGELKVDSGSILEDYNLIKVGGSVHGHTLVGLPTYTGGANPATWAGFALASNSLGKAAASDGLDLGATTFGAGAPPPPPPTGSSCDLNGDSSTNVSDVQLCANQAIGAATCSTGDINNDSQCNVVDVQRVVNAALGGTCVSP